jgi:hypothetical protein
MQAKFIGFFKAMQTDAYEINEAHGFNEPDRLVEEFETWLRKLNFSSQERFTPLVGMLRQARQGMKLMLITSELSETIEGLRKSNPPDSHIPEFTTEEAEMADAVIRIMNLATEDKCRLAEAIVAKQNYNRNRPFKHGGKAF